MNSARSNNLNLKPPGCKDIGIRKFEFMAKAQFLYSDQRSKIIFKYLKFEQTVTPGNLMLAMLKLVVSTLMMIGESEY